jgi:molybdate/tungstate transport system substrate-binding protein
MLRVGLIAACSLALLPALACKPSRNPVDVFAAASLTRVLADLEERFERRHRSYDLRLEISGSQVAARKVSELNRRADIVLTADHLVLERILRPKHADYVVRFATNELVLAHLEHSKYTAKLDDKNWAEILLRPDVQIGLVDPDQAPIGYRTLLLLELAQASFPSQPQLRRRLVARCKREHRKPHESELLRLLQTRSIDYAFLYRSSAEEHRLKFLRLPPRYNLGKAALRATYAKASVKVHFGQRAATTVRGAPVVYGLSIPRDAPQQKGALAFTRMLLGEPGARALRRHGFTPLRPARSAQRRALPAQLREVVE